ncbi:hypothetical protein BV22DRAFT_1132288 [Leucogyrophana mollusca]|uniref:Uncharacterized protein n=1 Tax=Leucogyrophana mollusca TaxID=85980 RepID=A0ACB8B9H5_9AGAM|nr:hypothetical protein BV22DRAFT_1132288 [Leucogyrophana mollusca]
MNVSAHLTVPTDLNETDPSSATPILRRVPPQTPAPRYRHAAPSGPWPWMDFSVDLAEIPPASPIDRSWKGYPQNIFGNWTPDQVDRSEMLTRCSTCGKCMIYNVYVNQDGKFADPQAHSVQKDDEEEFWNLLQEGRPPATRVRALFVDNLSLSVMKMLGTHYNIEPFFFSSSMNWIPSQYQEDPHPGEGDHITITLPFIRAAIDPESVQPELLDASLLPPLTDIDTQIPLPLSSTGKILVNDLLAIHMVRNRVSSTIISYHADPSLEGTSAKKLHSIVYRASRSVYWGKIFAGSNDPTFLLVAILWYALYAWDEAYEVLYKQITWLEDKVLKSPANATHHTNELHVLQAHLLHHVSLLQEFQKSVKFVRDTTNPALRSLYTSTELKDSNKLLKKECNNLSSEIRRLQGRRDMQSDRLRNIMNLAFATVNIEDSKQMRKLTEAAVADSTEMKILTGAAVRDSAAMKQVSYLTMIFLPASFTAGVFGMNVEEMKSETLSRFLETTFALTLVTAWLIVAFQAKSAFHDSKNDSFWTGRLWWPVWYTRQLARKWKDQIALKKRGNGWRGVDNTGSPA